MVKKLKEEAQQGEEWWHHTLEPALGGREPKEEYEINYNDCISDFGPKGHCTICFKWVMWHVDVHKGEGINLMWTHMDRGGGQKPDFLVDVING